VVVLLLGELARHRGAIAPGALLLLLLQRLPIQGIGAQRHDSTVLVILSTHEATAYARQAVLVTVDRSV
jgi:hypothetical protein